MRTNLEHGCYYTNVGVFPKNWKTAKKRDLLKSWYVQCKFYDPLFKEKYPYGFPFRKKLNKYKTLEERKAVINLLLKEIPTLFEEKGYNPITKKYMKVIEPPKAGELHPGLDIIDAFKLAKEKLKCSDKHRNEIRFALNRFEKGTKGLRMTDITIGKFKRSELKTILEYLNLTDNYFNKFRAYGVTLPFTLIINPSFPKLKPIVCHFPNSIL